ncbi:MAG: DUF6599 family protein [Candidatus Acidiferrales bacterium]
MAQQLLPNSFAGWSASGATSPAARSASALVASPAPQDVLNEYGWLSTQTTTYTRGGETLDVTLFQMKDPSASYGLYSYLRTPDMPRANLAEHSAMSSEHALALIGNLVLDIRGKDLRRRTSELKSLVSVVKPHAEEGILPTIWQHLPAKNMIERTDHYILGPETLNQFFPISPSDWLGFADGAEAETANYRLQGKDVTLLIADFPTPQTAQKKLEELQQKLNVNNAKSESDDSPILFAKRSVTLLAIVSGARTQAEANALLDQVQSGAEITWNEAPFEVTQPDIGTLIVGSIIGTGVICVFVLIASLAFGGVRLIVKRMLPGRIFDRDDDIQVLQLGLSSKPINAEDFYRIGRRSSKSGD